MKRWTGVFLPRGHNPETTPAPTRGRDARRLRGVAAIAIVGLVLAACSSSTATSTAAVLGATSVPVATSTSAATDTATPIVAATPTPTTVAVATASEATGVPTSLDPCQVVPVGEASQLAGITFAAGKEETTSGNGKICVYGGQTLDVFTVIVAQAPDVATAQAGKAAAEAQIQSEAGKGIQFTELPTFADGAASTTGSYTVSGQTFNIAAFYALKGTIFFGFSDLALNKPAPTAAALQAEAQTVLGRLP